MNAALLKSMIVVSVISAGLGASLSISSDRLLAGKLTSSLEEGLSDFDKGYSQYKADNLEYSWVEDCPPGSSPGDSDCVWDRVISNDGSVDVSVWESELVPQYLRLPAYAKEFAWSMGNTLGGSTYTCATTSVEEDYITYTMRTLRKNHREDRLVIGDQCDPGYSYTREDIDIHSGPIFVTLYL